MDANEDLKELINTDENYSSVRSRKKDKLKKKIENDLTACFSSMGTLDANINVNDVVDNSVKRKKLKNESQLASPSSPKRAQKRKSDFSSYRINTDNSSNDEKDETTLFDDLDKFDDMVPVSEECFQPHGVHNKKKKRKLDSLSTVELSEFEKQHLAKNKKPKNSEHTKIKKSKKIKKRDRHISDTLSKTIKKVVIELDE